MARWLWVLAVALGCLLATWAALLLLARRLPPGLARDLARFLPDCLTAVRRLARDPRVPRRAKVAIVVAGLWVASPIDLIPEFLPVIGPLDDVVVVALALRYAARRVPRQALLEAWPGEPRLLLRLLGATQPATEPANEPGPEPDPAPSPERD
ncbi:MAG: YkvA family protein [Micromonosporaceae bacterium]